MGSTFVDWNGRGFEANDAQIEIWLMMLVREIDARADRPAWLQEARDDWHLAATQGFGFGVMPDLDGFVTDEERRSTVVALGEAALVAMAAWGETITAIQLNAMRTGGDGSYFTSDLPTEMFLRLGRYFVQLLNRTLRPDQLDARFES